MAEEMTNDELRQLCISNAKSIEALGNQTAERMVRHEEMMNRMGDLIERLTNVTLDNTTAIRKLQNGG